MAAEILIDAKSNSGSQQILDAVEAGELWGVDMGTTSKASEYANMVRVECTYTRASALSGVAPEDVDVLVLQDGISSFSATDSFSQLWYLRGKL